MGLSQRSWH